MKIDLVRPTNIEIRLVMPVTEWADLIAAMRGRGDKSRRTSEQVKLITRTADLLAEAAGLEVIVTEQAGRPFPPAPTMIDGDPPPAYAPALS